MTDLFEYLLARPYPGRGIMLGTTPSGKTAVAYFIMGRSENSRNRVFEKTEDGIRTRAHDEAKMTDPSLIIYHPVRRTERGLIVTNGDQTDTIRDGHGFVSALRTRRFEPDAELPTEREIMDRYAVSRITVRRALDELMADGVIRRQRPRGRLHLVPPRVYQQLNRLRAHHTHDDGSLKHQGEEVDALDKTQNGDLTWLGLEANSDAYNYRNTHTVNYWASVTGMSGKRDKLATSTVDGRNLAGAKASDDVDGWATDLGVRLRLDPNWQVGAAYSRASANYQQTGLESNRSNFTGTRSRVHRFGEAFRGEMQNIQSASLFGSWQLRDEYDASLVYHKFWRVDGNKPIGASGINAVQNNEDPTDALLASTALPMMVGKKDLGQEMDLVVTKYFKQGLLPAALSQSIDEPSALVRFRGGVFKPGDAYGKGVDSHMHRAFVDVI